MKLLSGHWLIRSWYWFVRYKLLNSLSFRDLIRYINAQIEAIIIQHDLSPLQSRGQSECCLIGKPDGKILRISSERSHKMRQ